MLPKLGWLMRLTRLKLGLALRLRLWLDRFAHESAAMDISDRAGVGARGSRGPVPPTPEAPPTPAAIGVALPASAPTWKWNCAKSLSVSHDCGVAERKFPPPPPPPPPLPDGWRVMGARTLARPLLTDRRRDSARLG